MFNPPHNRDEAFHQKRRPARGAPVCIAVREIFFFPRQLLFVSSLLGIVFLLLGVSPADAELHKLNASDMSNVTGRTGLSLDIDLDAGANSFGFTDPNGESSGNQGTLILNNPNAQSGIFSPSTLTNFTLNADGSQGLVLGAPAGRFSFGADGVCVDGTAANDCSGAPSIVTPQFYGLNSSGSELRIDGRGEGLGVDANLDLTFEAVQFMDGDAAYPLFFDDVSLTSSSFLTDLLINADGTDGLVVSAPSGTLDAQVNRVCSSDFFGSGDCSSNVYGELQAQTLDVSGSELQLRGHGTGITADADLSLSVGEIHYVDRNGAGTGNDGYLGLNTVDINSTSELTNMTVDVDGNVDVDGISGGIVVGMPAGGQVDVTVDQFRMGPDSSSGNVGRFEMVGIDASGVTVQAGGH